MTKSISSVIPGVTRHQELASRLLDSHMILLRACFRRVCLSCPLSRGPYLHTNWVIVGSPQGRVEMRVWTRETKRITTEGTTITKIHAFITGTDVYLPLWSNCFWTRNVTRSFRISFHRFYFKRHLLMKTSTDKLNVTTFPTDPKVRSGVLGWITKCIFLVPREHYLMSPSVGTMVTHRTTRFKIRSRL